MEEGRLEEIIKQKLENHEEFYDSASWDQLSSKMDLVDADIEESALKDQLVNHQEPIIESHWQILKAELEALEQRRYRLWATKSIEAITLLLLIWTFTNVSSLIVPRSQHESAVDIDYAQNEDNQQIKLQAFSEELNPQPTVRVVSNEVVVLNDDQNEQLSNISIDLIDLLKISMFHNSIGDLSQLLGDDDLAMGSREIDISYIDHSEIEPLVVNMNYKAPSSSVLSGKEKTFKNRNDGWWIGAGFAEDINLINSGFNFGYLRSQVNSGLIGATADVSISWQTGPVELQSGLKYGQKGFAPGLLRTFTKASANSYLENQLDLIEFQQVQVPLMLKLHGLNKSKNHLYGFVGVSANAILGYTYSIQKSVQPSTRVNSLDLEPQIDLTELPTGFVQGGSLKTNSYLTGVIGFGFESRISDKVSFYLQPQYQHQLAGTLNDYVNRINSINIQTGLKIRL